MYNYTTYVNTSYVCSYVSGPHENGRLHKTCTLIYFNNSDNVLHVIILIHYVISCSYIYNIII